MKWIEIPKGYGPTLMSKSIDVNNSHLTDALTDTAACQRWRINPSQSEATIHELIKEVSISFWPFSSQEFSRPERYEEQRYWKKGWNTFGISIDTPIWLAWKMKATPLEGEVNIVQPDVMWCFNLFGIFDRRVRFDMNTFIKHLHVMCVISKVASIEWLTNYITCVQENEWYQVKRRVLHMRLVFCRPHKSTCSYGWYRAAWARHIQMVR